MSRFLLLRDWADFLFSFKLRRLLLWAVLIASAVPGTLYWHLPAMGRLLFLPTYVWLVTLTLLLQGRFFLQFAQTAFGAFVLGRKYHPTAYSTPEVEALSVKMRVPNAKVRISGNPRITGPFTNALTARVTIPKNWLLSFSRSENLSVIAHEFGHITRRRRFVVELMIASGLSYGFAVLLSSLTVILLVVFETAYISMAFLLVSFVSWRNEYSADIDGAKATGPEGLISVFELLKSKLPRDDGSETHPPLSKRIKRLEPLLDRA